MDDLTKHTPTELLKRINDIKLEHEKLKNEIIADTLVLDDLEKKINSKLLELDSVEKKYVLLVEELNNR